MPLGDSITAATCYRSRLEAELQANGTKYTMVGSDKVSLTCGTGYSAVSEGHSCYAFSNLLKAAGLGTAQACSPGDTYFQDARDLDLWFGSTATAPDIVLMHAGTNDANQSVPAATVMQAYTVMLTRLRALNPKVKVFVAKIIPGVTFDVTPINAAIPAWVAAHTTTASPITIVDMYTGFSDDWTRDGTHPNDTTGSQWLADHWMAAIKSSL